ncbi:MAG: N-acetylmuramoyl-L-alanine amidase, partial [Nevskia sp.]|nr:N-acetylmuramoyl-L-alanine amidase [Nevskia sp.]
MTLSVACAHAGELRELRLLNSPEGTRVVFDLDARADNNVFTLANPDRVVVDIAGVRKGHQLNLNPAPVGLIKGVRSGPHDGGLRVVLDLSGPATPKSFGLQPSGGYGYRLILDLAGAGAAPATLSADAAPAAPAAPAPVAVAPAPSPAALPLASAVALQSAPAAAPAAAAAVSASAPPSVAPAVAAALPLAAAPGREMALSAKTVVVAVDAGHGGDDPGTESRSGLQEKNVTLAIARMLARRINATPGMRAVLTRDGDYYVGLRERTIKARQAQADLFVSIHCNSYRERDMRGTAI